MPGVGDVLKDSVGKAAQGGKLGGSVGSVAGPKGQAVGTITGALAGWNAGLAKGIFGKDDKDPNKNLPSLEDPTQTSRMLEIDRIAKNIRSGTDAATQSGVNQNQQNLAATQNRLSRSSGGNSSALTDALLKAQRATGAANNQVFAQGQQRQPFYQNLGQQLSSGISQRSLELQLLDREQKSAERAQGQQSENVNRNAAIASGLPGLGDAKKRIEALKKKLLNEESDGEDSKKIGTSVSSTPSLTDAISDGSSGSNTGGISDGLEFGLNDIENLTAGL